MRRPTFALAFVLAMGCRKPPPPPPADAGAPSASTATSAAPPASSSPKAPPSGSSAFGPWVRCYTGFRPSGDPRKDVTRLAMMCGPATGMRAMHPVIEGSPGNVHGPFKHAITLTKGQCVRVFAVSSEGVPDLDLTLVSPTGEVLARDGIDDRWPILWPDRAVCVQTDGAHVVEVTAKETKGTFALQAWLLP